MVTKVLNTIVLILLILICVTSKILVDEIEKGIPEINYTIYEIKLPRVVHESKSPVLLRVINSVKEEEIKYKYKFYKKFEMIYYCTCDECRMKWTWGNPPRFKRLIPNSVAAANPKDLLIGTHITIDGQKILVLYNDESIPVNKIYIYTDKHDVKKNGICDVYKQKP